MRVKTGFARARRHRKIRKLARGYRGMRSTTFKKANEAVIRAGMNAYRDRRLKKRTFRSLWIIRLNAALRAKGISYSRFIAEMNKKQLGFSRKTLSELAIHEPAAFDRIVEQVGVMAA